MDINLEKIELVKDRSGVSYNEAKEALEAAEGSVVDAIVALEEKANEEASETTSFKDSQTFKKIKELVEKGNISQIKIKKDGVNVVNFPVTVGVLGIVFVPWLAVIGAVTALGTKCDIELIDDQGVVYDVNGKAVELYDKAKKSTAYNTAMDYVEKGKEYAEVAIEKGKEYAEVAIEKGKEYAEEYEVKEKLNGLVDKFNELKKTITEPDEVEVVEVAEQENEDGDR